MDTSERADHIVSPAVKVVAAAVADRVQHAAHSAPDSGFISPGDVDSHFDFANEAAAVHQMTAAFDFAANQNGCLLADDVMPSLDISRGLLYRRRRRRRSRSQPPPPPPRAAAITHRRVAAASSVGRCRSVEGVLSLLQRRPWSASVSASDSGGGGGTSSSTQEEDAAAGLASALHHRQRSEDGGDSRRVVAMAVVQRPLTTVTAGRRRSRTVDELGERLQLIADQLDAEFEDHSTAPFEDDPDNWLAIVLCDVCAKILLTIPLLLGGFVLTATSFV